VTTTQTPTAGAASNTAILTVLGSPSITKGFNPTSITSGGSSVVTLTLTNNNATALTGGAFSDSLVNMSALGGAVGGTCAGTTPNTLAANATALSFSGITIPASASCTVVFTVTSTNVAVNPNTTSGVTTTQTPTAGAASNTANLTVTSATPAPNVVSFNVVCGASCAYNLIGSGRTHLPWQVTGIQVVFSQAITAADINSLTGITATGFSGLGTNTLTWTFAPITNSAGMVAAALATTGPDAIQSSGGALTGANTNENVKILEGDFNDDGIVNASDLTLVNNARSGPYNIFADINGDGVVNTTDVTIVRAQNGQSNP
jgi:Dockerin type I domain